jgi:hypothetical protein
LKAAYKNNGQIKQWEDFDDDFRAEAWIASSRIGIAMRPWFETRGVAALLTMKTSSLGNGFAIVAGGGANGSAPSAAR